MFLFLFLKFNFLFTILCARLANIGLDYLMELKYIVSLGKLNKFLLPILFDIQNKNILMA